MPFNINLCYLCFKQYVTQVAAFIIKALFDPVSAVVHFTASHVRCDFFNFLSYA